MSSRSNRSRKLQTRVSGTSSNQPVVSPSAPQVPQPIAAGPQAKRNILAKVFENHQPLSNWATFGGFVLTLALTLWNSIQISEKDKQLILIERQLRLVTETTQRQHAHELAPRLLVGCPVDRIKISDGGQLLLQEAQMRIRNIGKGTAHHVVATVDFLRLHVDDGKEHGDDWKHAFPTQTVIAQKTIPAGESLPFDTFSYPLFNSTEPHGFTGTIGIYSVDDEGREVVQTQTFLFVVHLEDGNTQARLNFLPPNVRPEIFASRTGKNERTFADVEGILKFVVTNEHDRLRLFADKEQIKPID